MDPPETPPDDHNLEAWRAYALSYLSQELGNAAPGALQDPILFSSSPLQGEGSVVVFEFMSDRGGRGEQRYFVIVGRTEPNYYFAYDLAAADAFHLHLGTRFMIVMGVSRVDDKTLGSAVKAYDPRADARAIVDRAAPGATIEDLEVAVTFDVAGEYHAVLRGKVAGEPVYIMGRDAPTGFSRRVDLPPHVAYRLHLGHVLRMEPKPKDDGG